MRRHTAQYEAADVIQMLAYVGIIQSWWTVLKKICTYHVLREGAKRPY